MKGLLEKDFSAHYDPSGKRHGVSLTVIQGENRIGDPNACNSCPAFFRDGGCDHSVFIVKASSAIEKIDIEGFINSFRQHIVVYRCDLLLYDQDKIVLADMYCGDKAYLEAHSRDGEIVVGKKTKVRNQIEATLDLLYSIPAIEKFINSRSKKFGIMAYRDKYEGLFDNLPSKMKSAGKSFMKPTDALANRKLVTKIKHGFSYFVHKYPEIYVW